MIRVYYWPRELRLVMAGHAIVPNKEQNLICAGASALFISLCCAMNGFRRKGWAKKHHYINDLGIGYARIWSRRRCFKRCRVAMGMCVGGLMRMAEEWPDAVHVEVCTGIPFDDEKAMLEDAEGGVTYLKKFLYDMRKGSPTNGQKEGKTDGKTGNEA